jgi:hypothetical protein
MAGLSQQEIEAEDLKVHKNFIDSLNNAIHISFLINDASLSDSVLLMFGTGKDQSDLFSESYTFTCHDDECYLNVNGQEHQIVRHKAAFELELSDSVMDNTTYVTLYMFNNTGEKAVTLYDRLK